MGIWARNTVAKIMLHYGYICGDSTLCFARHKTLEMNAFQFQEQNSFDRDEELLNDASVFVGSARYVVKKIM